MHGAILILPGLLNTDRILAWSGLGRFVRLRPFVISLTARGQQQADCGESDQAAAGLGVRRVLT